MGQMVHDRRQPLVETGLAKHGFPPCGCGSLHTPQYAARREAMSCFKKPPLMRGSASGVPWGDGLGKGAWEGWGGGRFQTGFQRLFRHETHLHCTHVAPETTCDVMGL